MSPCYDGGFGDFGEIFVKFVKSAKMMQMILDDGGFGYFFGACMLDFQTVILLFLQLFDWGFTS